MFERGTLRATRRSRFANPLVGAVSGNARVGNLRTFVARCQSLEYICGFNLDRRAYTEWNCITVVPGAVSALRRSAIEAAGGFSHDTLAEDTDLTLTLHRLGYRIDYAPDAVAWTEAPETFATLAKQRFRWAFGTMQCLWKHRDLVFNPRFGALGWFSLPSIWFFQIGLVAVTPLVDAILLYSLIFGHAAAHLVLLRRVPRHGSFPRRAGLLDGGRAASARRCSSCRCASSIARCSRGSSGDRIFRALKGALVALGKTGAHRERRRAGA